MTSLAATFSSTSIRSGNEDTLIRAVQGGSEKAFTALVERHQQALRNFLRRACRDWALADDLAQETFLAAWSNIRKLESGANLRAWLCGIGYRKCLAAMRSNRRSRRRDEDYGTTDPGNGAVSAEDSLSLDAAMDKLSIEQRACIALCLAADFTHTEAAEALVLPVGTVKSHITRGRARLLAVLGNSDDAS
ncbi:MAG: RNA polymerase subunit sigma-70 [Phenylobacterium zucineum]|nr:MAG: RNA polymerase subunit sigma-70 [Phenylobacterium zucineum]